MSTALARVRRLDCRGEGLLVSVKLAARLQEIAESNMIVISDSARRMIGNLFEIEELAARELKGIPEAVRAWVVLRARSVESRFEALHVSGLTALVGREEESDMLLRHWGRAKAGEGQVVLLCGEAGIGKSRLTAAVLERIGHEPHSRLRYFCSPQHADSALYPIIGQIERAAGFAHDDTGQAKADELEAMLARTLTTEEVALLAEMLSVEHSVLELDPHQRRQRTLEAVVTQVTHLATKQALARSANADATAHLTRALALVGESPDVQAREQQESPWDRH